MSYMQQLKKAGLHEGPNGPTQGANTTMGSSNTVVELFKFTESCLSPATAWPVIGVTLLHQMMAVKAGEA